MVSIPGYHLTEELYNGSRTNVDWGYRQTDSLPVALKLLKNPYPSLRELVQFRNQYTIIQPYSLKAYQNGYALVMEDGGISLKKWGMGEPDNPYNNF